MTRYRKRRKTIFQVFCEDRRTTKIHSSTVLFHEQSSRSARPCQHLFGVRCLDVAITIAPKHRLPATWGQQRGDIWQMLLVSSFCPVNTEVGLLRFKTTYNEHQVKFQRQNDQSLGEANGFCGIPSESSLDPFCDYSIGSQAPVSTKLPENEDMCKLINFGLSTYNQM